MHYFNNFKGFADTKINLTRPFTLLIGPNGAGKTNTIEGVQLLSALAEGMSLHEITDIGRGGQLEIRGGIQGCAHYGKKEFSLKFRKFRSN